ncbi:MAG TPA: hypothetical protein VFW98_13545 [Gemmatimonadaceae bacterium]|nr:hypothetical protein [Gemmatimonadaceae bacterium]
MPVSAHAQADTSASSPLPSHGHFWRRLALGFGTSILAHEAGHVVAAYAVGGHPSFGFDRGRPTIYSGISARTDPHKQFIFSSAGLTVQALLNEAILDIPHHRGGAFERGLLAGGIATTLFYITLGRNANVSDVSFMASTSGLTKGEVSLIYGGVAAIQTIRIWRSPSYAHFFAAPSPQGGVEVGIQLQTGGGAPRGLSGAR